MAQVNISIDDPLQGFVIPEGEENDPFWSASNIRHVKKAIADIEAGKYVIHNPIEADDDKPLLISDEICPYCHQRHVYRGREMREALEETERMIHDPNTKTYNSFSEIVAEIEAEIRDEVSNS